MNKEEAKAKGIVRLGRVYVKIEGDWLTGIVLSARKDFAEVEAYSKDEKCIGVKNITYVNIKPLTEQSKREIEEEKAAEIVSRENFRKKRTLGILNAYVDHYNEAVVKFMEKFPTSPAYYIKWEASDIIMAQYKYGVARDALDYATKLATERGVLIEETIVEAAQQMKRHLETTQLGFYGVESTSKMEVLSQEAEARARVRILQDFQYYLREEL